MAGFTDSPYYLFLPSFSPHTQDLVRLFFLEGSLAIYLARFGESITLLPARLIPQAIVLIYHLMSVHRGEDQGLAIWWTSRVMTTLLIMLNVLNIGAIIYPFLRAKRIAGESSSGGNKSPSSLWYVHGKAYDLEEFYGRHPGGRQALSLGQGRDCTALFESYHPFTEKHRTVLDKYRVTVPESVLNKYVVKPKVEDEQQQPSKASSSAQQKQQGGGAGEEGELDVFYETLKARVAKVMQGKDIVASRYVNMSVCLGLFPIHLI